MKYSFFTALALMVATTFSANALEIGKPAPDFKVTDIYGKEQSISGHKGKIVVLEWTNPGCPFVVKHYDTANMQGLQKYAAEKEVVWISVNSSAKDKEGHFDKDGAIASVALKKAEPASYILDPEGSIGHLYGAKTTPHMYVIDVNGNLAYEGAIDDKATANPDDVKTANNYVRAAIDELLAGKPVTTAQTRAYGCSVKY